MTNIENFGHELFDDRVDYSCPWRKMPSVVPCEVVCVKDLMPLEWSSYEELGQCYCLNNKGFSI